MRVFISWSGEPSHQVALHLRDWLPAVLPFVEPWVSSEDIPKGARWSPEIAGQLEATDSGIVCLVPENIAEPWLHFEAGALSKSAARGRIHPFLLGVDPRALPGALGLFQATRFDKSDVLKLLQALNVEGGHQLTATQVQRTFELCWPDLEGRLKPILARLPAARPARGYMEETTVAPRAKGTPAPLALIDEERLVLMAIANSDDGLQPNDLGAFHPQRAQHIMERLQQLGLLTVSHNYVYGSRWRLNTKGRAFMVQQGWL